MSNARYPAARQGSLDGSINFATGVFRAALLRGYAYSPLHRTVANVTAAGGVLVAVSEPLTVTVTESGVIDASDAEFGSIAPGPVITALLLFQTSGPDGDVELPQEAQRLVAFINRARNLPFTPNGRNVRCRWNDGAERVLAT